MRKQSTKWSFTITASHSFFGQDVVCDEVVVNGTLAQSKKVATDRLHSYIESLGGVWKERPFRGWERISQRYYKRFRFNGESRKQCGLRIRIGPMN